MGVALYGAQVNLSSQSTCKRYTEVAISIKVTHLALALSYGLIFKHLFSLGRTHGKLIYDNRNYRRTYPRSDLRNVFVFYNSHISSFPLN